MRAIVLAIIALMLGGCMQGGTLAPATQAGWSARDQQLMSNLPYRQAIIAEEYRRHIVQYARNEAPGTIVIDTGSRFLYYVLPKGQAIRYGITGGERGESLAGPRHRWSKGRMPLLDTDRRRTGAAWPLPSLRAWRPAKSNGRPRAVFILRWQRHAVPYPRHQPARIYRPSYLIGL